MSAALTGLALAGVLGLSGVIHLIPASGLLSAHRLHALYGVTLSDPTLILLLRHRALLFGMLGAGFVVAAFVPAWRAGAAVIALISMLSFVALAGATEMPAAIQRVVRVDLVLSAALALALAAHSFSKTP